MGFLPCWCIVILFWSSNEVVFPNFSWEKNGLEIGKSHSIKKYLIYFEEKNISIVFYTYLNWRRKYACKMKWNTCSVSSKAKFQTRFNTKLFLFPNSLVCCLLGFLFWVGFVGFCFVFLTVESQRALCHFQEIDYGKPISLSLLAGLKRKTLIVYKQPSLKQFIYRKSSLLYISNTYLKPISLADY